MPKLMNSVFKMGMFMVVGTVALIIGGSQS